MLACPRKGARGDLERICPGEHGRKLRRALPTADFTVLVAPETSGVLARLTRDLEEAGANVLGSSARAVDLAGDKIRLAAHLDRGGSTRLPRGRSFRAKGCPSLREYPAVLKPVDGAGVGEYVLSGWPGDLSEAARRMPQALLQPFVPGEPMSASFLVSPRGPSVADRDRQAADGECTMGGSNTKEARSRHRARSCRIKFCNRSGAIEGLGGFVGVDFIWDEQRRHATILEINPTADDITRRALPALAGGAPGPGVAGSISTAPARRQPARKSGALWYSLERPSYSMRTGEFADESRVNRAMSNALIPRYRLPASPSTSAGPTSRSRTAGGQALSIPFEVWKRPDELARAIAVPRRRCPISERAVVTMTAELCDCYPTKAVGVGAVLDAAVDGPARSRDVRLGHRRRNSLGRRDSPRSADCRGGELAGACDARCAIAA